ncbi:probable serine/threonine-protein kinase clkA [Melitaea cinxia]|uniref:probable serine/threonine-protein kinase clkA n=1 Tax=Melitaea cinxia TaxID=113334 RepID=UPI001E26F463|nr:probable serine/threonine-protein kinase clkA [Melitaea cinxia]
MYVFIFVSTFMINFALYQAGPQNYANQGFKENGPPSPQINYSKSTNDNKNRHERESLYTKYFDGEKEVVNVGNGNNKNNVFYIGESPSVNSGSSISTDSNIARRPNNFNQSPANYYPNPQEMPNLGNRFGSNEPRRDITRINNIGNGMTNSHTFFISDLDGDASSVKVFSSSNNNNQRPNTQQRDYHPNTSNVNTNIQRNFNVGTTFRNNRFDRGPNSQPIQPDLVPSINNNANTNVQRHFNDGPTDTYNVFGHGQNNKNLVITNGNPVQGFGPNVNNYGNTNTLRNFDEGNHAIPTNTYTYNRIGNGLGNNNLFIINDKPVPPDSRTGVIYNDNVNGRRNLNQGANFNNKGTTNIHTYTRIGHGPNNRNMVIMNGETIYRSDAGISVTNTERRGQGDSTPCYLKSTCPKPFMDSGAIKRKIEKELDHVLDFTTTLSNFFKYLSRLG